jgi:ABC transport system ATP-binding/permease protein
VPLALTGHAAETGEVRIEVSHEVVIGREGDDGARLGDAQLSRRHARLSVADDGSLHIEDLGSANGTWVNGGRITGPTRLHEGDVVLVGRTVLRATELRADPALPEAPDEPLTRSLPAPTEQAGSPSVLGRALAVPATASREPAGAALLREGKRIELDPEGTTLGRDPDNDVVVTSSIVSGFHARVELRGTRWFVADLGTVDGTLLNGERLHAASRWLHSGDRIDIGPQSLFFVAGSVGEARDEEIPLTRQPLTIGRDPACGLVLDDPRVSRQHAVIQRAGGAVEVVDRGSRNGTLVDGSPVRQAQLRPGSEVVVGPFRLLYTGTGIVRRDDRGALRLEAGHVSVEAGGRRILNDASLTIAPGEFTVIIGESGAGKSTLLRALAGVSAPTEGEVTVNGDPVTLRLPDIGFVPQDEIVHRELTVREGLRYAARLRLPPDSAPEEVDAAIERVLRELALAEHADTRIGRLSGGQRKRAGMAAELLTQPSLLLLDEPTTGLDPGLESRMMELFRELAEPGRRSVTVVTHATRNLALADSVCVMGRGGELTFKGAPEEACRFFGVDTFDDIYTALDGRPAVEWRVEFEREQPGPRDPEATAPLPRPAARATEDRPRPSDRPLRQALVLTSRYLRLFARDRRNLALLLGQVPLIGLGVALLFRTGVFDDRPADAAQLLFLLSTTAIWLGAIDGSREIIKEAALAGREQAVGVGLTPYLLSKALVLSALIAVQVTLLLATVALVQPLHADAGGYAATWALLGLTGLAAVGLGLIVSAAVATEDQAASLIPLVLIPQLLFAGAIVPVEAMRSPMDLLAYLVFARWSFSGLGSAIDMPGRIAADPGFAGTHPYGDFFEVHLGAAAPVLLGFAALSMLVVAALLRWRRGWR